MTRPARSRRQVHREANPLLEGTEGRSRGGLGKPSNPMALLVQHERMGLFKRLRTESGYAPLVMTGWYEMALADPDTSKSDFLAGTEMAKRVGGSSRDAYGQALDQADPLLRRLIPSLAQVKRHRRLRLTWISWPSTLLLAGFWRKRRFPRGRQGRICQQSRPHGVRNLADVAAAERGLDGRSEVVRGWLLRPANGDRCSRS